MKFTQKNDPYEHWEFMNTFNGDRLRIVPERGGLITEWRCNNREILYLDMERFNEKNKSIRGGIPILFPICGNLSNDSYVTPLGKFEMLQHGFARDNSWEILYNENKQAIVLSLSENQETLVQYPYYFIILIEVKFKKNGIYMRVEIKNRSKYKMPFSFGIHPYFNITNLENSKIEGLTDTCINYLDKSMTNTNEQLSRLERGVDFLSGPSEKVCLTDLLAGIRIDAQFQYPLDLPVIWTDPPRKMVCLEPWTSPRNSLVTHDRLQFLDPEESTNFTCDFSVVNL